MPIVKRTFRVFVSSTFEDLKEERNALQKDVFPTLRRLCEQHGARFQAIDLRWGVRDEAAFDQKTVEICLREIERCQKTGVKPNFIVLLGQRYGWRSLPTRIEAAEFERVLTQIDDLADQRLVEDWYERDDNAVPAEFVLKPRTGKWVDAGCWQQLETQLHGILLAAARAAGLAIEALVKYWASATHQEILKGLGTTEEERRHVFAFCRDVPDEACDPDLANLRRSLKGQLPTGNCFFYEPNDLDKLCERVIGELSAIIESEARGFESKSALELEIEAHEKFAHERSQVFGREGVLVEVAHYLGGTVNRPLVLHGASGCGKSAVMARASKDAYQTNPHGVVVRRFIGVSPESSNGLTLLRSLTEQIGVAYGVAVEIPVEFNAVARYFAERLTLATAERPLMVFLDALDQLGHDDPARSPYWLANVLPEHCRIVVSTTELMPAIHECEFCEIETLQAAHADKALEHWLSKANRTLTTEQRQHLLAAFNRCGMPLYLKLAFEEARNWPSWSPLVECKIGQGIEGVIDTLLDRLVLDTNHGKLLVSRSLGYITAARYGLTEDEMLDVLSADQEVWSDFVGRAHHTPLEQRLPVIVWSRLSLDLEPYLVERTAPGGTVVNFYHRQLAERVAARFLADDSGQLRHKSLTEYFARQANWLDGTARKRPNAHKAAELPWQQRASGMWLEAEQTLLNCPFLFAKVEGGLVLDLDHDFRILFKNAVPESLNNRNELDLIGGALRLSVHVIAPDLKQFASQMVGRLLIHKEIPRISEFIEQINAGAMKPWIRPMSPSLVPPGGPLIRTLEGHGADVSSVALSVDGKCAVSASRDKTLKVWDVESGRLLHTLEGHSDGVFGVALSGDSRRAVSASGDRTLKVWDVESGHLLHTLKGHSDAIMDVALSEDNRRAVSASYDRTLKVWDVEGGRLVHTLEGHSHWVKGVALSEDGQSAVSASEDNTLKVWDVESGRLLRTLEGHSAGVHSVALSADGRLAVSASADQTLKVWNVESGCLIHTLEGHSRMVNGLALSRDGRFAVSASGDKTLKVWNVESGCLIHTLEGHSSMINGVALSRDGRRAVSASNDQTLKVWDVEGECLLPTHKDHLGEIYNIVLSKGNQRAISASHDHSLRVWDVESRRLLHTLSGVDEVALSTDGRRVVSASRDQTLRVWDVESGCLLHAIKSHLYWGGNLALSGEGQRAICVSPNGMLKVWNVESEQLLHTLKSHSGSVMDVVLSEDGRRAISASNDQTLKVWDVESGRLLHTLVGHLGWVRRVALSGDGRRAISASDDHTLKVWDVESGRLIHTLEGHSDWLLNVVLSGDGRLAVSASRDKTLKVWDVESGRLIHTLEGHSGWNISVALSSDGQLAASAANDKTLNVWDLASGAEIAAFTCDAEARCCAVIDNKRFVAGDATGRLHWLELME